MNDDKKTVETTTKIVTIQGVVVQLEFASEANREIVDTVRRLLKTSYMQKMCG